MLQESQAQRGESSTEWPSQLIKTFLLFVAKKDSGSSGMALLAATWRALTSSNRQIGVREGAGLCCGESVVFIQDEPHARRSRYLVWIGKTPSEAPHQGTAGRCTAMLYNLNHKEPRQRGLLLLSVCSAYEAQGYKPNHPHYNYSSPWNRPPGAEDKPHSFWLPKTAISTGHN